MKDHINNFIVENPQLSYAEGVVEIKRRFGIVLTPEAYRKRYRRLKMPAKMNNKQTKATWADVDQDVKLASARTDKNVTTQKYNLLIRRTRELEKEIEAFGEIQNAKQTWHIKPLQKNAIGEATAVAVASDWHIEETVDPRTVNGDNEYNLNIARKRAEEFFQAILKHISRESSAIKIDTLVLALLGDFITGNIHEENLENCSLRPVEATLYAYDILSAGIEFLLKDTKLKLVIPTAVGNHSRITKKVHASTERGNSLEMFLYAMLSKRFNNKRVTWIQSGSYLTYVTVYDNLIRFHHGHAIRYGGGVGGLTIPAHKAVMRWNKQKNATLDVFGHHHQRWDTGRFIANGSQIGYNAFALSRGYEFDEPMQQFFLVDKKRGVTVRAPILYTV